MLDELLYADDMDKNASLEAKMQKAMDQVSQSCDNCDFTISKKRQWLFTNQHLETVVVDKFTYLGCTLSIAVRIDDEVTAIIAKASVAIGRLRANIWERNGLKLDTKLEVYKAVVLSESNLMYVCETKRLQFSIK